MDPPNEDSNSVPSESGTPSAKRGWSFRRRGSPSIGNSSSQTQIQSKQEQGNLTEDANSGGGEEIHFKQPQESQRKSLISNILSPFGKLAKGNAPVGEMNLQNEGEVSKQDATADSESKRADNQPIQNSGANLSKPSRFSSLFIPNNTSVNSGPFSAPLDTGPSPKSTLQRVLSTTIPLFSRIKTGARPDQADIMNPMLHIATFAMNEEENPSEAPCSIHNIMPTGLQHAPVDFWDGMVHDESSVESSDEQEDSAKTGTINFTGSNEFVGSFDNLETESPLVFADTKELSAEEKLKIVFDLPEKEKYYKEFACWLVRSVLLKGYLYVTENHMCFYSSLPIEPGVMRKEGFLQKRSMHRPKSIYYTYWFVLKTDGLYIYADNKQLYFPRSTIYLKNVVSIVPNSSKQCIHLKTLSKTYILRADTVTQMNEWVEAISAAVLNAKNAGNDIRVVLPFNAVADLRIVKSAFNNYSIRVMAVCEEAFQPEEYYFSYFNDVEQAYTQLKTLWDESKKGKIARRTRLLHMKSDVALYASSSSAVDLSAEYPERPPRLEWTPPIRNSISNSAELIPQTFVKTHRKSNSFSSSPHSSTEVIDERNSDDQKRNSIGDKTVSEKKSSWWTHRKTSSDGEDPTIYNEDEVTPQITESKSELFKSFFAVPQNEKLLQTFSASFMKVLPLLGKLYVSTNYICFKSIRIGFRVKAVIALSDIVKLDFRKGYSPFYFALVITTKNQDEIVFDFHSNDARQKCHSLLVSLLDGIGTPKMRRLGSRPRPRSAILQEIDHQDNHIKSTFTQDEISLIRPLGSEMPKPAKPMHITCLTIGTRGDVQPYIALCKGLMEHGHKCRISTHEEYQEWIEGFGIEFRPVKGNPAELMQLCVDYGMFTMGFIREGLKKFRGWVEELLESCWTSCQGTDLIIESPTAFGGIHVAEALQIPFFSAFPFPWTRTRSYPHPFGVAERHMGGSYNYMTYVMIEQILWKALVISVNPWRKTLGLEPLSIAVEDMKTPFLYSFSPSVVQPPPDWPDWIHECGYWFLDNPDMNWTPPESLKTWLKSGSTPVYIGFGSIIVQNPDEMTKIVVEAVVKSGVRAILSKGWSSRSQQGPQAEITYPDCIYPLKSVPHDWLFPQLAGVVHHGGAGTTAAGLRAGCPTIIHPFFGDQFFWAERVTDLGVGVCVRKLTPDSLAQALIQITTDSKVQERAKLLGERIKSENGVKNAIHYIYRDLDYAKNRIKQIAIQHKKSSLL